MRVYYSIRRLLTIGASHNFPLVDMRLSTRWLALFLFEASMVTADEEDVPNLDDWVARWDDSGLIPQR